MSSEIVPQVDIGVLTLRGLSGIVPLLAAVTADDVSPLAMIQLDNLGGLFHVNGKYAAMVPDLLQRCPSQRLDKLGVVIGWRKGDAASVLAQSAGGQAIALLTLCIRSLYSDGDAGSILYHVSQKALSRDLAISSIAQLARAVDLLASKMSKMGFGNILAKVVLKIQDTCAALGTSCPVDFFELMTLEAVVELLYSVSRIFSEEGCFVRICGTQGMGTIATIISVLFPEDLELYVGGLLIFQGPRQSVLMEINLGEQPFSATHISVEKKLYDRPISEKSITVELGRHMKWRNHCSFKWQGHLADTLDLQFSTFGILCRPELHASCCSLLHAVVVSEKARYISGEETPLPEGGLLSMLGARPLQRIRQTLTSIFRVPDYNQSLNVKSAYESLRDEFHTTTEGHLSCPCNGCYRTFQWNPDTTKTLYSSRSGKYWFTWLLWEHVGDTVSHGLASLFVEPQNDCVTTCPIRTGSELINLINYELDFDSEPFVSCEAIHRGMFSSMAQKGNKDDVAGSNDSSTLVPQALLELQMDQEREICYRLYDGQLLFEGRYYKRLQCVWSMPRAKAEQSLTAVGNKIVPSFHGEHSSVTFSVREHVSHLELRTTLFVSGHSIPVHLGRIIVASMGVTDAGRCTHARSTTLASYHANDVYTSSVASPLASDGKTSVVQTKDNPTAQLFACERGARALIQRDCCLNCAISKCKTGGFDQVIVGCR